MPSLRIVVLGASGQMGARVIQLLRDSGHDVIACSRATGVDARTGAGLREAFFGADRIVDCLNIGTLRARTARDFFTATAEHVVSAARASQVKHLTCLSIVNTEDSAVAKAMGYYAGKAAQARIYRSAGLPVTLASTTQWFELTFQLLHQVRLGPVAIIPRMLTQPVAAASAARFLVDVVQAGPEQPDLVQLAGPETMDLAEASRRVAAALEPRTRVVSLPVLGAVGRGALLPRGPVRIDDVTFDAWLRGEIAKATGASVDATS